MMVCRRRRRIARTNCSITWFAVLLLLYSVHPFCSARDTLTYRTPISDNVRSETLVSTGGKFELGFFTPLSAQSSGLDRRYVGIWYHNMSPRTVVWVANREDQPVAVNSTSIGVFAIKDGKLQVLDNTSGKSYWSTGLETSKSSNLMARLMDSGNLVLLRNGDDDPLAVNNIVWQSFQNPTDTFIPGMLMDKNLELTSWRDEDDPGIGNFTFKLDQEGDNQYVISRKSIPYWKSGEPGEFSTSAEMPPLISYMLSNFSMTTKGQKNTTPRWDYNYTRLVLNFNGELQFLTYTKQWNLLWLQPKDRCNEFNACGNFGSCNSNNRPWECKCLPGFSPQFVEQWNSRVFNGGCARQSKICEKNDMFLSLKMMKVEKPNPPIKVDNETVCKNECLSNCLCQAYSYAEATNNTRRDASTSSLCWTWLELNNLEEEYGDDGHNISIRIALSDLGMETVDRKQGLGTNGQDFG